jgi:hypothetical protein
MHTTKAAAGACTLRSRHSVPVQVAGNGVRRLALPTLPTRIPMRTFVVERVDFLTGYR